MSARVYALVVAAGRGVRFGGPMPKQWLDCAGAPLLSHTLTALARAPGLEGVAVVIPPDDRAYYDAALHASPAVANLALQPAHGGPTRQASVRLGLESLAPLAPDI